MSGVLVSKIFIIQSIPDGERETGSEIDSIIRSACIKLGWEPMGELFNVESKDEFINILLQIEEETKQGVKPYLHFEMHGSDYGLYFSNDDMITWEELKFPLRKINILSGNNTYISLATCYGASALHMCSLNEPCPFFGYVGPEVEVRKVSEMQL